MWFLRGASVPLKLRCLSSGYRQTNCFQSEMFLTHSQLNPVAAEAELISCSLHSVATTGSFGGMFSVEGYSFASQAGGERGEAEDDELSEHEANWAVDNDDNVAETTEERLDKDDKDKGIELFRAIVENPKVSVNEILSDWVEEGKALGRKEVALTVLNLRQRKLYPRALQFLKWVEDKNLFDFTENDYASRIDLIAKLRGLEQAEQYTEKIPKSFKGEVVYRTLLANCVLTSNLKKAEQIFNKMRELEFPLSLFACNQLLILYKRFDSNKIAKVLSLMEKEDIKPSQVTYNILIDAKGRSKDIKGMEKVLESMNAEGVELDIPTKALLARHYLSNGLKGKAESVMKEMEGGDLDEISWVCSFLLPLYGELGAADEVERVWRACESDPRIVDCVAAIEAWGKLKKIDRAEAVFEMMLSKWKDLRAKHYSALLKVYVEHKMLEKGKDLIKKMIDKTCKINPGVFNEIVKLYVEAGEVEKADNMLQNVVDRKRTTPAFTSYMAIMEQYAKKGDIPNAERIFQQMREAGYTARHKQFETLVQAYVNAKAPAYGIRERLRADNLYPSKALAAELTKVDAFRTTPVSALLE